MFTERTENRNLSLHAKLEAMSPENRKRNLEELLATARRVLELAGEEPDPPTIETIEARPRRCRVDPKCRDTYELSVFERPRCRMDP